MRDPGGHTAGGNQLLAFSEFLFEQFLFSNIPRDSDGSNDAAVVITVGIFSV